MDEELKALAQRMKDAADKAKESVRSTALTDMDHRAALFASACSPANVTALIEGFEKEITKYDALNSFIGERFTQESRRADFLWLTSVSTDEYKIALVSQIEITNDIRSRLEKAEKEIASLREQLAKVSLEHAKDVLSAYYEKHKGTVQGGIYSQWTRGLVSGRGEAINILTDEIKKQCQEEK